MSLVARIQDLVDKLSRWLAFLPPAAARLTLGYVFLTSGWGKLHSLDQVAGYFETLHIPAPAVQAAFVAGVEFIGGILLLAGLLTRVASVMLACTMTVALFTAFRDKIEGFGDLTDKSEYLYLIMLIWLAIAGAGLLSLDTLARKLLVRRRDPSASGVTAAAPRARHS